MTFDCMTADELAGWLEAASSSRIEGGNGTRIPCTDCPMWFHLEEVAAGRCQSRPMPLGGRIPGDGRGRLHAPEAA